MYNVTSLLYNKHIVNYEYIKANKRIDDILSNKKSVHKLRTNQRNKKKSFLKDGCKIKVAVFSVEISDSNKLFSSEHPNNLTKMLRIFFNEIINILKKYTHYKEISIYGDSLYAIYTKPSKTVIKKLMDVAILINTFNIMYQKSISKYNLTSFDIGVGISYSDCSFIKIIGAHSNIWVGNAMIYAKTFSNIANKKINNPILIGENFFNEIKDIEINGELFSNLFTNHTYNEIKVLSANICDRKFKEWIDSLK